MILIDIDVPKSVLNVELITFETKCIDFMRFLSIFINLLEFFRIMSFVFDLKYLSQNSINFNMLGVFWNPQDEQISKLSLDLYLEQHLKEILRFFTAAGAVCHHCISTGKRRADNFCRYALGKVHYFEL